MPDTIITEYFYGDESQQFQYFRIPRLLITSPRFKNLSVEAKLLYGMMLDRMSLSVKNEWYDDFLYSASHYSVFVWLVLRPPTQGVGLRFYLFSSHRNDVDF